MNSFLLVFFTNRNTFVGQKNQQKARGGFPVRVGVAPPPSYGQGYNPCPKWEVFGFWVKRKALSLIKRGLLLQNMNYRVLRTPDLNQVTVSFQGIYPIFSIIAVPYSEVLSLVAPSISLCRS